MQSLRQVILDNMRVLPNIDPVGEIRQRIDFLKGYLLHSGRKGFVLGISGGQDSALTGKLAQIAVNELNDETTDSPFMFYALQLPYGDQKDIADALEASRDFIKADRIATFNIKRAVDAIEDQFNTIVPVGEPKLKDFHKGNTKARIRMSVQYAYAGQYDLLVLGTDNSAENLTGFATLGGDLQADLVPIFGLNKRQGRELLKALGSPEKFYTKAPTADLLDNAPMQTDETELGFTYEEIDDFLEGKDVKPEVAKALEERYVRTDFKRHLPTSIYG